MKNEDVLKWFQNIEREHNIQDLKIKDLSVWPILRWQLFKHIMDESGYMLKKEKLPARNSLLKNKFAELLKGLKVFFKIRFKLLPKADIIFSGAPVYMQKEGDGHVNKFFDPIISRLENKHSFLIADYLYNPSLNPSHKRKRLEILYAFNFYKKFILKDQNLESSEETNKIIEIFNKDFKSDFNTVKFYQNIHHIFKWASLFQILIRATKAKFLFGIGYYTTQVYGLNLAAHREGVYAVDIQHGPQGQLHPAYSKFLNIPNLGFSSLPSLFWVWDQYSFDSLQETFSGNNFHKVFLGGNPWHYYSGNLAATTYGNGGKTILYTIQPLVPVLPEVLIHAIETTPPGYNWWFRLHPRMSEKDLKMIKQILKEKNVESLVEFEKSSALSLPELFKVVDIHISKSSGCIMEADMFGVPNIIIDELGIGYYKHLIDNKGTFGQTEGDLWPLISTLKPIENLISKRDFQKTIDSFFERFNS